MDRTMRKALKKKPRALETGCGILRGKASRKDIEEFLREEHREKVRYR